MKHKHVIILILSALLFFGLNHSTAAQDDPAEAKGAEKSHKTLKKMPSRVLKILKLTKEEAADTAMGKKIKVFVVGLDKLNAFNPGDNSKKILVDTKETVYPVYTGGILKTSLSIRKRSGGWKNASFGGAEIHLLEPVRKSHSSANKLNETAYFAVRVPAMYLSFLGYYQKGELYLIPTHEHPDVTFELGKGVPAGDIYIELKSLVNKYKNVLEPPKGK